ncbi:MAG: T9SS type A sorting domain-containing protein [Candidatus Marinimicrobia bacterium]|nr:T9SS type A sorting domain-containing protein [Candidatus Neomarinimicrobiota bacterium]
MTTALLADDPEIVKFTVIENLLDPWGGEITQVNTDGSVFAGRYSFGGGFYYRPESGIEEIVGSASPRGMANDGTLVGSAYFPMILADTLTEVNAACYYNGEEWVMIGPIAGTLPNDPNFYQSAWAIAADTFIVAGMYWHENSKTTAFVWTPEDPDGELLPDYGLDQSSRPNDMSANGELIVGWASMGTAGIDYVSRAAHAWVRDELTGDYELLFLGGLGSEIDEDWLGGEAYGCSADGNIVVGRSGDTEMFVWTDDEGMLSLGHAPGHDPAVASVSGLDVSSDTTIVGFAQPVFYEWGRSAIIYSPSSGIVFLKDSLENLGLEDQFEDWSFLHINTISDDGKTLAGSVLGLSGIIQPYTLEFIAPSTPTDLASEIYNDADGTWIDLTWTDDPTNNEFSYTLQRRVTITDSTSEWATIANPDSADNSYRDSEIYFANGVEWEYRLRAENPVGESDWVEIMTTSSTDRLATGLPTDLRITGAYPNPFNPSTTIQYEIPEQMNTKVVLYSVTGAELAVLSDGIARAGAHSLQIDMSGYSSGVYLVRIISGDKMAVQKLTLIK